MRRQKNACNSLKDRFSDAITYWVWVSICVVYMAEDGLWLLNLACQIVLRPDLIYVQHLFEFTVLISCVGCGPVLVCRDAEVLK
jgi:hypothetical protein